MEFSSRTAWDRRLNALSLRLEALRKNGESPIDLTESNPTHCGLSYPKREIAQALADVDLLSYEPDPRGLLSARVAVAEYSSHFGASIDPEHVILCTGTSEAYAHLFKLLCDPGDNVLIPQPSYPLLDFLTGLESVETRPYLLRAERGWSLDMESLIKASDQRTRAVVLINPGNPTGVFLKRSEFNQLCEVCAARGWGLVVDEVFANYAFGEDVARMTSAAGEPAPIPLFALSGLSKVAGLPQLKTAWTVVSGPSTIRDEALARLELVADTFLSVGTPVQQALPRLISSAKNLQRQIRDRLAENRTLLEAAQTKESAWKVLPSEGGWYAVLEVDSWVDEEHLCLALLDRGVLVHPGYFFDFPTSGYLVISLLPEPKPFRRGTAALASVLKGFDKRSG